MKLTFERKLPLILFIVFLTLVAVGFVSYQYTVSLQDAAERKSVSQSILIHIDRTLAEMLDADYFAQEFYTIGNSTYEDRYLDRKRQAIATIGSLRGAVASNPVQAANIQSLEQAVNNYWLVAERRISARKQDSNITDREPSTMEFRTALSAVRSELDRMRSAEQNSSAGYGSELDKDLYRTVWILIIASVAGIVSLLVANVLVVTEGRRRAKAETALVDANRDLETRIEESTNELRLANENLQSIAAEREQLLENEKAARREAEIANRLRDEFMATVSHELRTPLNSILGWARMLRDGSLDERQEEKALSTIIKNSETQNRLIEDLIDVARLISGKLNLDMRSLEVGELLSHSIESVMPAAGAKKLDVEVEIEDGVEDLAIVGDQNRLEQVFTNLLTNSVKFTPESGSIKVEAHRRNGSVEIAVEDSGVGISPEFLPMVFERFRQDSTSEARNNGLGLGLAIVRNLVEMHGGEVRAESEGENCGARFTVTLPLPEPDMYITQK
ncbi:MAG: ATP-binding protein [Pyrinomonadaceae bacterium]|nr:ATP-binding protein [Pyrinomonadaceae bacterium]